MKKLIILFLAIFMLHNVPGFTQAGCKVLVKGLQGTYTGGCKKGLANGEGTAVGIDSYSGGFKKGLPNGQGTYSWATGEKYIGGWYMGQKDGEGTFYCKVDGRDTILTGVWIKDKYTGPKPVAPLVKTKYNITNVEFSRRGDGNTVYMSFYIGGGPNPTVGGLNMFSSSGSEISNISYVGYERVTFPFTCRITYTTKNAFRNGSIDCILEYVITQPGNWYIRILN